MSAFLCYSVMHNSKDREVTTNIHGHREHAIYGVQLYIALQKMAVLQYMTTWMNLQDLMLSETSQSQRDKYHMFSQI